jgi:hypothetical protein
VVFDNNRWRLAPAEKAQAESEPQSQKPTAVDSHDPAEAFAETGRETVKDCLQPACSAGRNPKSDASPEPPGLPSAGLGGTRTAKALTAPNPFHKLPRKS